MFNIGKLYDGYITQVIFRLKNLCDVILARKVQKNIARCGKNIALQAPVFFTGGKYMEFGDNFTSCPGLRMECIEEYNGYSYAPQLIIGNNVSFNFYCHVGVINKVIIGNDVLIGSRVLITDHSHGILEKSSIPYYRRKLLSKGPVVIEDNVWIGENVCIMPGVTIGKNSIVGANAVVTHDVLPFSIVAGVPAIVVKSLL